MTPRTPLTSVPSSFALVLPYKAKADTSAPVLSVENTGSGLGFYSADSVLIETTDLTPGGSALADDDLIIEARDAIVGLYSNSGPVFGSGIVLGEIAGFGTLTDKWAMVRQTTNSGALLDFTFGDDPDYTVNPRKVRFDTTGRIYSNALATNEVSSGVYKYSSPKNGYATLSSHAFHPKIIDSNTDWVNADSAYFQFAGGSGAVASIQLPHGAVVTSFGCEISDVNSTFDLSCRLLRQGYLFPPAPARCRSTRMPTPAAERFVISGSIRDIDLIIFRQSTKP
ncbi:MAG: hypothetical protein ACC655_07420 [Rhodothermia bacterium]